MAFAQTISDMIMTFRPKNIEEAKKELKFNHLWNDIKRNVDDKTKKRYLKYIYLYLEKELQKSGIKDERPAFPKKSNRCEVCGGDGYHKMSCYAPRTHTQSETENTDIKKKIEDAYSKFKEGKLKSSEFDKLLDNVVSSASTVRAYPELVNKLKEMGRSFS
jgi:hypothetical protein